MDAACDACRAIDAAGLSLRKRVISLESSPDKSSPRYLDTKGTTEARLRELERRRSDHEAESHYLDLLVMCADTLALMPLPKRRLPRTA